MIVREATLDIDTPSGPMRTAVFAPLEPGRPVRRDPGLVLYSEIFQLTGPVRRLAMQFASLGYVVMAPEVYHANERPGTVLGYDDAGKDRGNALKRETPLAQFDADCRSVLRALADHPACNGHLGAVGICLGGHLAFRAALHPEVRATACFYATDLHTASLSGGDDSLARVGDIRGELLMVWGRQDPHVPLAGRRQIHDALSAGNANFTWHEFNAAHAFLRDEGERYDPALARLAIGLAADLFSRCL